jgi:hypothetical protein
VKSLSEIKPVRGKTEQAHLKVLRKCWSRWTDIIALFAGRRRGRHMVDPRVYKALRNELITVCHTLAETDSQKESYYLALAEIVRPWLSLGVLRRTDLELLGFLLLQCQQVDKELNRKAWWRPRHLGPSRSALALTLCGAFVFGVILLLELIGAPVIATLRDQANTIWFTIRTASDFQKFVAIAVILIVISIYTVQRTQRA